MTVTHCSTTSREINGERRVIKCYVVDGSAETVDIPTPWHPVVPGEPLLNWSDHRTVTTAEYVAGLMVSAGSRFPTVTGPVVRAATESDAVEALLSQIEDEWIPPAYMDRNDNGTWYCNRCKFTVVLFDDDTHEDCEPRDSRF